MATAATRAAGAAASCSAAVLAGGAMAAWAAATEGLAASFRGVGIALPVTAAWGGTGAADAVGGVDAAGTFEAPADGLGALPGVA